MCGKSFCEACEDKSSHREEHYGSWLAFIPKDATVLLENKRKSENENIYFNEFRMPYGIKDEDDKCVYQLNEKLLKRIIEEFLSSF